MTKKIPVRAAQVGQILAEPVVQGDHQILLREGTELEASHLELLRQRGVALVTVEQGDGEGSSDDEAKTSIADDELKRILLEESQWFGDARKEEFMAEVFRWVVAYRAGRGGA